MRNVLWWTKQFIFASFFAVVAWTTFATVSIVFKGYEGFSAAIGDDPFTYLIFFVIGMVATYCKYQIFLRNEASWFLSTMKNEWFFQTLKESAVTWQDSIIKLRQAEQSLADATVESDQGTTVPAQIKSDVIFRRQQVSLSKKFFWRSHAVAKSVGFEVFPTFKEHLNWEPQKSEQAE